MRRPWRRDRSPLGSGLWEGDAGDSFDRSDGVVIQGTIPPPLLADLLHVLAHQLGQLEHGDGRFPAKDRPQRRIRIDLAFVLGILQAVSFDVIPEFLGDLRPR